MKSGYENIKLCAECGGLCCKKLPGCCHPEDFNITNKEECLTVLQELLSSGKYAIDWWENYKEDSVGYFVRPATKGNEGRWFDPSWGGECIFLTLTGCSLSFKQRPKGCRELIPGRPFPQGCTYAENKNEKREAADAWWEYRECFEAIKEKPRMVKV